MRKTDVLVSAEGTIVPFELLTHRAEPRVSEHVQGDAQFFGKALVLEHGYARELAWALQRDGFRVGGPHCAAVQRPQTAAPMADPAR